jgi:hypothetical protein
VTIGYDPTLQIPPRFLAPYSTLEKSAGLAAQAHLLVAAAAPAAPEERLLGVVRWLLSSVADEPFGRNSRGRVWH